MLALASQGVIGRFMGVCGVGFLSHMAFPFLSGLKSCPFKKKGVSWIRCSTACMLFDMIGDGDGVLMTEWTDLTGWGSGSYA